MTDWSALGTDTDAPDLDRVDPVTDHVLEDLSAYIIAGRVRATPNGRYETDQRSPRQGIDDGVEAERIGFRRVS